jgi:hypothetical protein
MGELPLSAHPKATTFPMHFRPARDGGVRAPRNEYSRPSSGREVAILIEPPVRRGATHTTETDP